MFDNPTEEAKRVTGHAFIPVSNEYLQALGRVNGDFLRFAQQKSPQREATLDQDTSLVETYKQEGIFPGRQLKPLKRYSRGNLV